MHLLRFYFSFAPAAARAAIASFILLLLLALLPLVAHGQEITEWEGLDIGPVGLAGNDQVTDGVVTLRGSGADIWGAHDAFRFLGHERPGDGAIVARLTNRGTGHAWAKVGLMFREDLGDDAPEFMIYVTPANHFGLQYRTVVGGATTSIDLGNLEGVTWLMIIRQGNSFRAYRSRDGNHWDVAGSAEVAMAADAYAGLAASSHDNGALITATFDNASQFSGPPPPLSPPAAPGNFIAAPVSPTMVRLYWDTVPEAAAYELERATGENDFNYVPIATFPADTTSYADTGLTPGTAYRYRIRTRRDSPTARYSDYAVPQNDSWYPTRTPWPGAAGTLQHFGGYGTIEVGSDTLAMNNTGIGIGGTYDGCMVYGWRNMGDLDVSVRITGIDNTDPLAQAGLMIRSDDYGSGDLNAAMVLAANGTSSFITRAVVNAESQAVAGPPATLPYWVRVTRVGDLLSGYVSPDGVNWTQVGSLTIALGPDAFVGCVHASHTYDYATRTIATFDRFNPALQSPPDMPSHLRLTTVTTGSVRMAWEDNSSDETGFDILRWQSSMTPTIQTIQSAPAGATTFEDVTVAQNAYYTYHVRSRRNGRVSDWGPYVSVHIPASPDMAPPSNLRQTGATTTSIQLAWNDNSTAETGFEIHRLNWNTYTRIGTVAANVTSFTDTGLAPAPDPGGRYSYQVRAIGNPSGSVSNFSDPKDMSTTPDNTPVWKAVDFGYYYPAGSTSVSGDSVTLSAAGGDFWGTFDTGHFYYYPLHGDGSITVRVASLANTNAWAKAGVMIRESTETISANVAMLLTAGNVSGFQVRSTAGGETGFTAGPWVNPAHWVRLTRVGNIFSGYVSPDGTSWTLVGTQSVVLAHDLLVGLAASAHSDGPQTTAVFDHLNVPAGPLPPAAPGNLRVSVNGAYSLGLAWDDNSSDETGFEVEQSAGSSGAFTKVATLPAGSTSYSAAGLAAPQTYRYRVRASGPGAASDYSNIASGTTTPYSDVAAPSNFRVDLAAATSLRLAWTDNSSDETSFELARSMTGASSDYAVIATPAANSSTYLDSGLTPDKNYFYRLRTVRNGTYSAYVLLGGHTTPADTGNWAGGDIGAVGPAGSTTVSSDGATFTLRAGGGDIEGTADAFRFHYMQVHGDTSITTRVASLTNTNPWAKAGVMIRETFAPDSPNATMVLTAGNVCGFQTRATAGAGTVFTSGPWLNPVYWVRLTRVGNLFTGYVSPDGTTWTQIGSRTVAMGADVFVGLAASAHSTSGAQTTAVFDHVTVPGSPPPPPPPPPPTGWAQVRYGGTPGSFTETSSGATLTNNGGDFWGTSDVGLFVLREWTGDATIIARLNNFTYPDGWSKAGLMIRQSAGDARGVNAFVGITGAHGHVFQSRTTAGAQTTSPQSNGSPSAVQWLKLVRNGNTLTGYYSLDGRATWTQLGSATITMGQAIQVGFAVSSHKSSTEATAAFTDVTIE